METLPVEVLWKIAEFMTAQEVAACCAVNQHWRDVFGDDVVWKCRCDPHLEEHLRTIPCVVEPGFVSPEVEDTTLSPVGHWRMAFMRENHLWNNWSIGKFVFEPMNFQNAYIIPYKFISCNCVVIVHTGGIELWDVSSFPPALMSKSCFAPLVHFSLSVQNYLILVFNSAVQVFSVNTINGNSSLKYTFFLDEETILPGCKGDETHCEHENTLECCYSESKGLILERFPQQGVRLAVQCVVKGNTLFSCLRCSPQDQTTLHVWNIEKGEKITKNVMPTDRMNKVELTSFETSDDILVKETVLPSTYNLSPEFIEGVRLNFFIYSTSQLRFLSFRLTSPFGPTKEYMIHKHYFVLQDQTCFKVYNYLNSDLLLVYPFTTWGDANSGKVGCCIADNRIVINLGGDIFRFDPISQDLKPYPNLKVVSCEEGNFIRTKNGRPLIKWKGGDINGLNNYFPLNTGNFIVNNTSSRCLYTTMYGYTVFELLVYVFYFW